MAVTRSPRAKSRRVALDPAEQLVAEHEPVLAVGRDAEQALGDLAVGAADADLERAHEHRSRRVGGLRHVGHLRRVLASGDRDQALHRVILADDGGPGPNRGGSPMWRVHRRTYGRDDNPHRRRTMIAARRCTALSPPLPSLRLRPSRAPPVAGTYGAQRSTDDALTADDLCAVRAALASGDPRRERAAREVLAGSAGVLALADPWILHHHGLNTARGCATPEG